MSVMFCTVKHELLPNLCVYLLCLPKIAERVTITISINYCLSSFFPVSSVRLICISFAGMVFLRTAMTKTKDIFCHVAILQTATRGGRRQAHDLQTEARDIAQSHVVFKQHPEPQACPITVRGKELGMTKQILSASDNPPKLKTENL